MILRNAGWDAQTTASKYFNFCVPLYVLLGFCEDYKRVMINARHELILIRAQRPQLSDGRSGDRADARIIHSTMANAARVIERDK